jgi:transposase
VIAYHLLAGKTSYQELGGEYFDRRNVEAQRTRLMCKLEALGVKVTIETGAVAA